MTSSGATVARRLGALALLAVGLDHLEQYAIASYSAVPTIGTLFLLNFASATLVALVLLAPLGAGAATVRAVAALGGISIAAGSLVGLLASEANGLFGFREQGYRFAVVLSLGLDVAAMLLLGAFVAAGRPSLRATGGRPRR